MKLSTPRITWQLKSNLAYDALCLLNIWTGDPFYTSQHAGIYERWIPRLNDAVRVAHQRVAYNIREKQQGIISAQLCLIFSAVQPETLEDLIKAVDSPHTMIEAVLQSPYVNEDAARNFLELIPDLRVILEFLRDSPFAAEQLADLGDDAQQRQSDMLVALERYDVVTAVESQLGMALPIENLEVFTLAYTAPHGIKIIGSRFITALTWSPTIVVRVAAHELMHPPFDHDAPEIQEALTKLSEQSWLYEAFLNRNPQYGYNTWADYVEENCVRALDQVIGESFGIARDASERWRVEDEGMHVLAAALTPLLRTRPLGGTFQQWLVNLTRQGILQQV